MEITNGFLPLGSISVLRRHPSVGLDGGQLVGTHQHIAVVVDLLQDLGELRLGHHVVQIAGTGFGIAEGARGIHHQ